MHVDLRAKHDIEARKAAIELFEQGRSRGPAASLQSIPQGTVRKWLYI